MAAVLSADSGPATLEYLVENAWSDQGVGGLTAKVTINAGGKALSGWTISFNARFEISNLWNAEIVSHVGTRYVIRNTAWNGAVAAGEAVSFGFQATTTASGTEATHFKLNGTDVDDPVAGLPTLDIDAVSFAEGDADHPGSGVFTVTLSEAAKDDVTVDWTTASGTAVAGSDFIAASGTLTFAAGETKKTIRINAIGDGRSEANETFTLNLANARGATLETASATGTIRNDDAAASKLGWLSTSGNQIVDTGGHKIQLTGVNWFGFESSTFAPHGLSNRSYQDMMDQMLELGFNTIRLPFSSEMLHATALPSGINLALNPDLTGLTPLEVMDRIIDYAGSIGMRVILDHHRSEAGVGTSGNGLWYNNTYSEDDWIDDWQMLAKRYAKQPAVVGADLHNEPYSGTWGDGGVTDWARAATEAGNAIGAVNKNWLIFVEGTATYANETYWWGGNLMGVRDHPIKLALANKLVYSVHDYPNSVHSQTWFQGDDFAKDLPEKFREMWGYIFEDGIAPIYIGEFGTKLTDPKDIAWLEVLTDYLGGDFDGDGKNDLTAGKTGPSWTYWSWNPNSGDTGGLLNDDWTTVNLQKLAYLQEILSGPWPDPSAGKVLNGTSGNDRLIGTARNDSLNGRSGNDTLVGGAGDDVYFVDTAKDRVIETARHGTDEVRSSVSYTLSDHVERLVLTGSADLAGRGNGLANRLTGNAGANRLDGKAGADTLVGGAGDDVYFVDTAKDRVIETARHGTDEVRSSVSYTLSDHVERLVLTGSADLVGQGNGLANRLTGNAGANRLDGKAGADTLVGGAGDDVYFVDTAKDRVIETARHGTDEVRSSVSYTLPDHVERLVLTGSADLVGQGNGLANRLTGNAGANRLDGKAGADTLVGGAGNDVYSVDAAKDRVIETARHGTDEVRSSVSYTLSDHVERLVLTGSADLAGRGNDLANRLTGNAGANRLDGKAGADTLVGGAGNDVLIGGVGADILTGGRGADRFVFSAVTDSTRSAQDRILDFEQGRDLIDLSDLDASLQARGNQAFSFIGAASFSGASGELRAVSTATDSFVQADLNGDRVADFSLRIAGSLVLKEGDFVL